MKYVIMVPDGMADYPLRELGWRTPLMVADAPVMKSLGRKGEMGTFRSLPRGAQAGSDTANMSILGYDPVTQLTGRGALEAASLGIELGEDDIAFRCNLLTVDGDRMDDYSAGYITDPEARKLVESIDDELGTDTALFRAGRSFRNILVLSGGHRAAEVLTTPPHDIVGQPFAPYLPKPVGPEGKRTARVLGELMSRSKAVLENHPINAERVRNGLNPANMIWPWGPGGRLRIRPFKDIWGISGVAIAAVDTVKGLARSAGMDAPDIPGATGFTDTDYEAKADYALRALRNCDLTYVHAEATDEMGHAGDVQGKIMAIENFDSRLTSRIIDGLESGGEEYRLAVIPDHFTPCTVRTHVRDPTPFVIYHSDSPSESGEDYSEESAKFGRLGILEGDQFMKKLIKG